MDRLEQSYLSYHKSMGYRKDRMAELTLYQQGFVVCDACGDVKKQDEGFASATYGWRCFDCQCKGKI